MTWNWIIRPSRNTIHLVHLPGDGGLDIVMLKYDYSYLQTLLVTGGYGGGYLSSTETFSLGSYNWVSSSPSGNLPSPRSGLSGVTIGYSVFVAGIS